MSTAARLEALLRRERDTIVNGDLSGLESLLEMKQVLVDELRTAAPLEAEQFEELKEAADINADLPVAAAK